MRVNNLSNTQFFKKRQLPKYQKQNNNRMSDIFIPSHSKLYAPAFCSNNFNDLYKSYKKNLKEYIISEKSLTIEGLENVIQNITPQTTVDIMENSSSESIKNKCAAFAQTPFYFDKEEKKIKSDKGTIYVSKTMPENNLEKVFFIGLMLHEGTHILQETASDRTNCADILNKYYKNLDENTLDDFNYASAAFLVMEELLTKMFNEAFNYSRFPDKIDKNLNLNKIYKEKFDISAYDSIKSHINIFVNSNKISPEGRKFILDFIKYRAKCEKEALQNESEFLKEFFYNKTNIKTIQDLNIELYNNILLASS